MSLPRLILTIDFGDVYPGQTVTESFTISSLGDQYDYTLTLEACVPARDMTPRLLVEKDPAEAESEPKASIDGRIGELTGTGIFDQNQNDTEDKWFVTFFVPNELSEGGYECQISIKHNINTEPPPPPPQSDFILMPIGAGNASYFAVQYPAEGEHWQKVDEEVSDGDATYVADSASDMNNWDWYNIDDLPSGITNIYGITLSAVMRGEGTDMTNGFFGLRTSDGTGYWTLQKNLTASYQLYSVPWIINPKTGSSWTVEDINNLQVGFFVDMSPYSVMYATQIYVLVDVTPQASFK